MVYERGPDNTYQRQEVLEIKHRGDGAYDLVNEKGETLTISFHALRGDLFVGQAKGENDQPGYGYTVLRVAGNEAVFYVPQCDPKHRVTVTRLIVFSLCLTDEKVAAQGVEGNGERLPLLVDKIIGTVAAVPDTSRLLPLIGIVRAALVTT